MSLGADAHTCIPRLQAKAISEHFAIEI